MPEYVVLIKWTDAGAAAAKNTLNRINSARTTAQQYGGRIISQHWTQGPYDEVRIVEFPDDESFSAAILSMGLRGFVHTESMRAYTEEEMRRIVEKLPDTVQGGAEQGAPRQG
jgi:uncharacterized protein with GYD domain